MTMTYAELLTLLQSLTEKQLAQNLTVQIDGEYFPAYAGVAIDDAVLDDEHIVIAVE